MHKTTLKIDSVSGHNRVKPAVYNTDYVHFYDFHPKPVDVYSEILLGLTTHPKSVSAKFFYDSTGSKIFESICDLPEYYLTRTEISILKQHANEISNLIGKNSVIIEPGSGSSQKVRLLLDTLKPHAYVPMEISKEHLLTSAEAISMDFPWLVIHATCTDFTLPMELPYIPKGLRKIAFFPGSTIGNFYPIEAVEFLKNIREMVGPDGGLLIGVDLKKDVSTLTAAYDDSEGITAEFNINLLRRINRELNANFIESNFSHFAFYNADEGRMESHLVSKKNQNIDINENEISFYEGETIHTENSYKYHIEDFQKLALDADLYLQKVWTDADNLFSVQFYSGTPSSK